MRITKPQLSQPVEEPESVDTNERNFVPLMVNLRPNNIKEEYEHRMNVSTDRANYLDLQFLEDVTADDNCPEYNGYNGKVCRKEGQTVKRVFTYAR